MLIGISIVVLGAGYVAALACSDTTGKEPLRQSEDNCSLSEELGVDSSTNSTQDSSPSTASGSCTVSVENHSSSTEGKSESNTSVKIEGDAGKVEWSSTENDSSFNYTYPSSANVSISVSNKSSSYSSSSSSSNSRSSVSITQNSNTTLTISQPTAEIKEESKEAIKDIVSEQNCLGDNKLYTAIISSTDLDATTIDCRTVAIAGEPICNVSKKYVDINKDGLEDLLLCFEVQNLGLQGSDIDTYISGTTFNGQKFNGCTNIQKFFR
ncbi:MAG: hypothetical protein K6T91_10285 [Firmicutes bacterium]|nr:hypothetical protein [Bacillota bacterium]